MAKPGTFDPLEDAKWNIEKLKKEIEKCNAVGMASHSSGAFGHLEAAFYRNDIDEEKMVGMKNDVEILISSFGKKCKCQNR